jgi:DNA polymerase type B, organellar and viral
MPATSPEAIERKREADNERRKQLRRSDPEFSQRETRARAKRAKSPASADARARARAQARAEFDARPFVGCDGEGLKDAEGRSRYALFRMGERELYDDDNRLMTPDLLRFILDHPDKRDYLIAFAFDYDASNILRDLPADRLEWLLGRDVLHRSDAKVNAFAYHGGYTWHRFPGHPTYGVMYMPRHYLRVCKAVPVPAIDRNGRGYVRWASDPDTVRTIYDAFGNFQNSFLNALNDWKIGSEHWEAIAAGKAGRGGFTTITPEIREYCAIECRLLATMMEEFRSACLGSDIPPASWDGAGKLATALMQRHGVIRRKEVERRCPVGVLRMAHAAYYGGRFEVTRCGLINRPVHAFDIRSAYPDAMRSLPCLVHGRWHTATGAALQVELERDGLFVCNVQFRHPPGTFMCGLPWRSKETGSLCWPRMGAGVYWSPEIRSAQALGCKVELFDGWIYEKRCDCVPMPWLEDRYEQRRELDKLGPGRGKPLKLGYNAVYGKTAQRIGSPPYANPIYAGLATALTRAKLNRAILAAGPRNVVMIATDALYTVGDRLPKLDIGLKLGQWEHTPHPSLFIVRPGLYWPPKPRGKVWKLKTRGISEKFLVKKVPRFRAAWRAYCKRRRSSPIVKVKMDTFVGLRLARHLKKPDQLCQWIERTMQMTFECSSENKRGARRWHGQSIVMQPLTGNPILASHVYKPDQLLSTGEPFEEERLWLEAMPDPVDLGPPHTE